MSLSLNEFELYQDLGRKAGTLRTSGNEHGYFAARRDAFQTIAAAYQDHEDRHDAIGAWSVGYAETMK